MTTTIALLYYEFSVLFPQGFDVDDFQNRSYTFFGPGSEYDNPLITDYVAKQGMYLILDPLYTGNCFIYPRIDLGETGWPQLFFFFIISALTNIYPINTPWRNFSLKDFIKNYEAKIDPTGNSKLNRYPRWVSSISYQVEYKTLNKLFCTTFV